MNSTHQRFQIRACHKLALEQNQRLFKQPRTQKEALATLTRQPDGTVGVAVPENLWNNLSVQKDVAQLIAQAVAGRLLGLDSLAS